MASYGDVRRVGLHKGAIMQQFSARRVFKGLGVAKRYCSTDLISDTFVQCGSVFWRSPRPF